MDNNKNNYFISHCLELIEKQFDHGDSREWSQYDFEKLGNDIQEKTGVVLSVSTLKRLYGRVKYESAPSLSTLNALANYLGSADWRAFKIKHPYKQDTPIPVEVPITGHQQLKPKRGRAWWIMAPLACILIILGINWIGQSEKAEVDASEFSFRSNKILSRGVPNTVVFNYDAKAAGDDSVYISQSWDLSKKKLVDKNKDTYSAIYYYPGYFEARLLVENQVVSRHGLQISTDGWMALADQDNNIPVYFKRDEIRQDSFVTVSTDLLQAYHIPLQPQIPVIRFFNIFQSDFIRNDNFHFRTKLKSDFGSGAAACHNIQVTIQCKNDGIAVPLVAKGCTGNISLFAAGNGISSEDHDLSGFGYDPGDWVTLEIVGVNKHLRFIVNGQEAYALDFPHEPADIIGVEYHFLGPGTIRSSEIWQGDRVIDLF
ncbi:hypothetical protein COR50_04165 [Chitinophaga caeni]|uniref:PKD domain-containing protein n=1 Tax=Chitinophaga caeni TaxID=2029983 RepID=A0A291QRB1_9BACT|nr:hypothetical protein [Chitinophaga caeni]ATL46433.1 hypothetical protein COR50_04165 [Chitinophaga caeni]